MSKYKNKRLHISIGDVIFAIVFLGLLIVSAYFCSEYQETKGKFNIEQTSVDFIVEAPSKEQVAELESRSDIDKVVPYAYRSVDVKGKKKSVNTGLYVIQNASDLNYTVFSDKLSIERSDSSPTNPIYISSDIAKNAGVSLNDTLNLTIGNTPIEFIVIGIYKSDYRNAGGTAIIILQNDVMALLGEDYNFNGAYISSNDISATKTYLDTYIGMGDLRSADEFDSDNAYQQYLENRKNKNSSESVFNSAIYITELGKRYNSKLMREFVISIGLIVGAAIILLIDLLSKTRRYTKSDVEKDIRNNFTLKQEKQMFGNYNTLGTMLYILAVIAYIVVSYFIFNIAFISVNNIIALAVTIISAMIARTSSISKLNKQFSIVSEKIKKEKESEGM